MALTNIELYEALKKDVSEDSARMIAEAVPKAQDIATKTDMAALAAATKADIAEVKAEIVELKGYIDSRLLRFTLAFFVPMWAMTAGLLGVLIAKV